MRTRRQFTPVLDYMPSRIALSTTGVLVSISIPVGATMQPGADMPISSPGTQGMTMQNMSSTNIAGEPTAPGTINC